MTAPNERADVANLLADHLKRIRILEAVVNDGCDCVGGHCLPSIWTSDCATGEVTGTTSDPLAAQTVLTLYSLNPTTDSVFHTGLLVDQSAQDASSLAGIQIGQTVGQSSSATGVNSAGVGDAGSFLIGGDYLTTIPAVAGSAIGLRGRANVESAVEADIGSAYGVIGDGNLTAGGYGYAVGVAGTANIGGQDNGAGGTFFVYGGGLMVGVVANYCIDVTIGDLAVESVDIPQNNFGNPAASTVRMYAYDNAGTLEYRANLNATVTILATETPPAVTGSRAGNAALASLLTTLAANNLILDSTTA